MRKREKKIKRNLRTIPIIYKPRSNKYALEADQDKQSWNGRKISTHKAKGTKLVTS